ncbi:MAG TPA: SDR family NAD(P)-dependent oxidoreductase, partial [Natronoarchaeum rubrum]|nr:SDR family NAD(P)-dependent oxidoreductase [Natronoarchaeum rubrum]
MADTESDESTGDGRSGESVRKTVLITGCSSGIGRESALAFLDDGWTVYATARNVEDIAALGEAGCETAELDVTDENQCRSVVERG